MAADVFDGPADRETVSRFLGPVRAPDPRTILILSRIGDRIVGFVSGVVTDHPDKLRALFIIELGVNDATRRRGLGWALLAAIRTEGRARGCRASWVLTEAENSAARRVFGASSGRETTGVVMYEWDET